MVRTSTGGLSQKAHAAAPAWWWFAAGLVITELAASAAGIDALGLAAAALIAPGFALSGLLPRQLRSNPTARLTASPALGIAATSIVLISIAKLGVPLNATTVRIAVFGLVLVGLAVPRDTPDQAWADRRSTLSDLAALGVLATVGMVLGWRVIGDLPVPGDDWAKYLLYADEIRRHGHLLLENPLWMGGRPFSEDPGVPSLEGAALLMTGAPAGALARVILLLLLVQLGVLFGTARAYFGLVGAIVAAGLFAVAPATQNILGWHGLANVGALAILALVLAQLGAYLAGDLDRRAELGLAITLVGVAAAHRLTAAFMVGMLGCVALAVLLFGPRRQLILRALRILALTVLVGCVVALDLRVRAAQSGGTLPYTSYLASKVDLGLALRDLTAILVGGALLTIGALSWRRTLPRTTWPAVGLTVVAVVLAYAWVLHLPLYYSRAVFFLPLPLALIAGAGAGALAALVRTRWPVRGLRVGLGVAAVITAVLAAGSWRQAENVRQYYAFASPAALSGLDTLADELRPNEIVATDRCWSFLATWLLHTRTYPALEEQDIQPKAELVVARQAAEIMHGTAAGVDLAERLGVRYAVLDPTCPVTSDRFLPRGRIIYAGGRLAIVELDRNAPKPQPAKRRDPEYGLKRAAKALSAWES